MSSTDQTHLKRKISELEHRSEENKQRQKIEKTGEVKKTCRCNVKV